MKMIITALGRVLLFVFFVAICAISEQECAYAASMSDYCIVPPSMAVQAKPNVNILMDYSGSMQLPAYIPCSIDETYENGALQCGVGEGVSYDATKNYYGYFNGEAYYEYGSARFSAKSSCSAVDRIGSSGCISGNLLNWITSTRIDTVRKALVGGRTSTGKNIVLESEGAMFTYTDTNLGCTFSVEAPSVGNRVLSIADGSGKTCPLGTLGKGAVKVDAGSLTPSGIIDKFFPKKMDLEFSIFKTNDAGLIRAAKNPAKSSLVAAIGNEQPADATPTGEALWEAYDFLRQVDDHTFESNNDQLKPGNDEHDPYYSASSPVTCRKSFVLLISDGVWNGDVDPAIPAHALRTADLRTLNGVQQGAVYVIHAFGDKTPQLKNQGRNALITTAIFGGFRDRGTNDGWPFPFTKYAVSSSGTCADYGDTARSAIEVGGKTICNSRGITYPLPSCSPSSWNVACSEWGRKSDGLPYNFFDAEDGHVLEKALEQAFNSILTGLASGTSASMVNNNTGSGAALLQAMFYPNRRFEGEELAWTGELRSLWYYIDPFLDHSSIREETGYASGNHTLDLVQDYVLTFDFDKDNGKTTMYRWSDSQGNGKSLVSAGTVTPEAVGTNWRAGESLRDILPEDRTILTSTDGKTLINFSTGKVQVLSPFLAAPEPGELISYLRGKDDPDVTAPGKYRSRLSTMGEDSKVWKLGDIISSSPKAQSPFPLNIYHLPNPNGYGDQTYADFVGSTLYKDHQSVYVGANDGMLHAFKLGVLRELNNGTQKASLSGSGLGREAWAYIPKGTLPYLKHLADPFYDHLYYVDGPLKIFDAAIHAAVPDKTCSSDTYWECNKKTTVSAGVLNKEETSWRTILIGGMGIGGAVRAASSSCSTTEDCVKTPDGAPADAGYSSYFALDVTDDTGPPQLMWEFSGEPKAPGTLGFSTTGPAIVRVGDKNKNGRWFAIFGSGPTGPIDVSSRQFLGRSDQNLRLFVVDIATGKLITTIDTDVDGKPLAEKAFAGSLAGAVVDTDRWNAGSSGFYSDDAVYVGYVQKDGSGGWTKGGVLRLATKNSSDPKQWVVTRLIDGIGPVTTSVAKLQDRKNRALWVFFGTGRYFYKTSDAIDSPDEQQAIYGVRDPCYTTGNIFSGSCTASVAKDDLTNQTDNPSNSLSSLTGSPAGWIINLDGTDTGGMKAERVITDPVAAHNGAVFFTTFRPNDNPCGYGGDSFVWAVRYDTGGVAPAAALNGKALVQVSTGALNEVNLAGDLGAQEGRRTTTGIPGMPPAAQGLTILARPKPAKKLLHVQER